MKVLYVYYGTLGLAGAYIQSLAQAFSQLDCHVYMAVSAYYRFPCSYPNVTLLKWFFPASELTAQNLQVNSRLVRHFRKPLRYLEQFIAYVRLLWFVLTRRIDTVNISLIDDRLITFMFVVGLKLLHTELIVTAHDVTPFGTNTLPTLRRSIFHWADRLLIHNEHARDLLVQVADIPQERICWHVFPLSDYWPIINSSEYIHSYKEIRRITEGFRRVYLFLGVIRYEKGLDILIEQWLAHMCDCSDCLLLIAGYPTIDVSSLEAMSTNCGNIQWHLRRLRDEEMVAFMDASDVITVPYRDYAHSSIYLASYIHSQRCVIASDNALFREFIDESNGFMFTLNNVESLGALLRQVRDLDVEELRRRGVNGHQQLCTLLECLPDQLSELYKVPRVGRNERMV